MVCVKGQPPRDSGSPWYLCFSRYTEKTLDFCAVYYSLSVLPGALAFHWPLWEPQ